MQPPELEGQTIQLLKQGIQAARQGRKDAAQKLLLEVIERDERNEAAWLWMSGVVDSDNDRLVCLENVLAINPNNVPAQKGLAELRQAMGLAEKAVPVGPLSEPETVDHYETKLEGERYRIERPPISAAAAVLYPERQVVEVAWQDSADLQTIPDVEYKSKTSYDDIWEKETDICAYCAHEVAYDENQCPQCKRKLINSYFRYPNSGADLVVYFVLVIGTSQMYFIQALTDLVIREPLLVAAGHVVLFATLLVLSFAVFFRKFWGYTASLVIMIMILLTMILDYTLGISAHDFVEMEQGVAYLESLSGVGILLPLLELLPSLRALAVVLAVLYGLFKAGPDFERVKVKELARVDRGLKDASMYYAAGKEYAKEKMWAKAVLHYRRAAANEPNRPYYHLALGKAYAELGFKERAIDALQSARRLTTDDNVKTEIEASIAAIQ